LNYKELINNDYTTTEVKIAEIRRTVKNVVSFSAKISKFKFYDKIRHEIRKIYGMWKTRS